MTTDFGRKIRLAMDSASEKGNILQSLRESRHSDLNEENEIAIAYELQSGSYVELFETREEETFEIAREISAELRKTCSPNASVLDCGSGEMTMLAPIVQMLDFRIDLWATDISWSRLSVGREWWSLRFPELKLPAMLVSEMSSLPFPDSQFDVVMTVHALEPNGGNELQLLKELTRVARKYVLLIEPNYEEGSEAMKKRMEDHGYVKGIASAIADLRHNLVLSRPLRVSRNPLNQSWIFLIELGDAESRPSAAQKVELCCPNSGDKLRTSGSWLFGEFVPLAYPTLDGIPLLRPGNAVVARRNPHR